MIIIDEKRIFEIISQRKPVTVALNAPDGMLPQVQETAVNITKKFDIPAFVLADTTWGTCDLNSNGAKVLGAEILFNIGHTNKLETFPGEQDNVMMIDAFDMVKDDPELEAMVVVGEIGGDSEEILAQHIIDIGFKKPIVGYIAGRQAPKEKRMGHAGAIVMGTYGSAESKISMFAKANIPVAKRPGEVAVLLAGKMNS